MIAAIVENSSDDFDEILKRNLIIYLPQPKNMDKLNYTCSSLIT
jgi:hypothetical protein